MKKVLIEENLIPFRDVRIHGLYSMTFFAKALQNFKNLKILKVFGVCFPDEEFATHCIRGFIHLAPRLVVMKLKSIAQKKRRKLGQRYDAKAQEMEPCDWEPLISALLGNNSIKKLSLVNLDLGRSIELRQMISDLPLYNEYLTSLNIQFNKMIKLKPLIQNVIRNRLSQLSRLIISGNHYDIYDLKEMLALLNTKDTIFGER